MNAGRRIAQLFRPIPAELVFFAVLDIIFHGPFEFLQLFRCQQFPGLGHAQGVVLSKSLYPGGDFFFQLFSRQGKLLFNIFINVLTGFIMFGLLQLSEPLCPVFRIMWGHVSSPAFPLFR
jgi:hypothetical protein